MYPVVRTPLDGVVFNSDKPRRFFITGIDGLKQIESELVKEYRRTGKAKHNHKEIYKLETSIFSAFMCFFVHSCSC